MKKVIFMTGGGGAGTIAAASYLKKTGRYRIVLGDMHAWAAGLRFADKSYILPAAKSGDFVGAVRKIIDKERVEIFVPLVDEEILKSYGLREFFPDLQILLPEYRFAKAALDKWSLINTLKKNNLPCPETYLFSEGKNSLKYPLIAKPRIGRGSRNMMQIGSDEQLGAYRILSGLSSDQILLQEKIPGREFTVSVVANKNGSVLAVVPKEIILKKGITIAAVTRDDPNIRDLCIDIQGKLKANGPFNVQLILKDDGKPVIFEINPRYSTTIALTMAAGVNEIDILISERQNHGKLLTFKKNLVMSRFYNQVFFKELKP
jgi:carbamoyl-phosphate synthase large subunit